MEFRPCIDIHNGKVKQIVGGSLKRSLVIGRRRILSQNRMLPFMQNCIKKTV